MRPARDVLPGGIIDQAARRHQFERDHPDAEITRRGSTWTGSLVVCRRRRETTAGGLERLLDQLDHMAALAAEVTAIEADYPGWRVWLSDISRLWAVRQGPDGQWTRGRVGPITVSADDTDDLRAQLADATAQTAAELRAPLADTGRPGEAV